jgi:hypothetical protein
VSAQDVVIAGFGVAIFDIFTVATLLFGYHRFKTAARAADLPDADARGASDGRHPDPVLRSLTSTARR